MNVGPILVCHPLRLTISLPHFLKIKGRCIKHCALSADRNTSTTTLSAVTSKLEADVVSTCLLEMDRSALPNEVSAELPADE